MDPNAAASFKLDELKKAARDIVDRTSEYLETSNITTSNIELVANARPYRKLARSWNMGPVSKGQHFGRCTKDEPDPDRPGRVRYFHFTKGWRYRRGTD